MEDERTLGREEATKLDQPRHLPGLAQNGNAEPLVQKGWKIQDSHSRALSQGAHLSEGLCASLGHRWCSHGEAGLAGGRVCGWASAVGSWARGVEDASGPSPEERLFIHSSPSTGAEDVLGVSSPLRSWPTPWI